jgi:predicted outer membrane repeat protein
VFTDGSSPTIVRCTFAQNDGGDGGGVNIEGASPTFEDCTFSGNMPALGGGVWVAEPSQLTFTDCVFEDNSVGALGNVWGGGISAEAGATITLEHCQFIQNGASSADEEGWGGAIYILGSTLVARSCTFEGNQATRGGAIYVDGSADLTGCVLRENQARFGGALVAIAGAGPTLRECTLFDNGGSEGAGGIHVEPASGATLTQTIIAFGIEGEAIACTGGVTITCSDLFGNPGGDWVGCIAGQLGVSGNIAADPLFCHTDVGDLTIADSSPCAPAQSACGLIGAFGAGCQVAVEPTSWGAIKAERSRPPSAGGAGSSRPP